MNILILDDANYRHRDVMKLHPNDTIYSTYNIWDAQALLKTNVFDLIYLDHDLNDYSNDSVISNGETTLKLTGEDFVTYMLINVKRSNFPKKVIIISTNEKGAAMMEWLLNKAGIETERMPLID